MQQVGFKNSSFMLSFQFNTLATYQNTLIHFPLNQVDNSSILDVLLVEGDLHIELHTFVTTVKTKKLKLYAVLSAEYPPYLPKHLNPSPIRPGGQLPHVGCTAGGGRSTH